MRVPADGANGLHVLGGSDGLFHASDLLGAPRLDPAGLVIVIVGAVLFARARGRVRGRDDVDERATARWTAVCWGWGLFAVLMGTCSGLATDGVTDPSVHLIADTLLFAFAGPLFAVSGPWTLAFAAAGPAGRERIQAVLAGRVVRVLTNPVVSLLLFFGLIIGLYFGGLYPIVIHHRAVADLVEVALVATSYLWCWSTFGPDPVPRKRTWFHQICAMFLSIPFFMVVGMGIDSQPYPPVSGQSVFRWHMGGDVVWSTGMLFGISGLAALIYLMVRSEERSASAREATSAEADRAQLALWRATRDAIAMEEALARSTVVEERPSPSDPGTR